MQSGPFQEALVMFAFFVHFCIYNFSCSFAPGPTWAVRSMRGYLHDAPLLQCEATHQSHVRRANPVRYRRSRLCPLTSFWPPMVKSSWLSPASLGGLSPRPPLACPSLGSNVTLFMLEFRDGVLGTEKLLCGAVYFLSWLARREPDCRSTTPPGAELDEEARV